MKSTTKCEAAVDRASMATYLVEYLAAKTRSDVSHLAGLWFVGFADIAAVVITRWYARSLR